jgi:DNA-binding Lrp family transcriptional regulator
MLSAYVLIETEVGKVAHVVQALNDLDGVQVAEDLAGPYDVIAKIHASGLDQLGRLVASRIQAVVGVTRSLSCTVIHREPQKAVATTATPPSRCSGRKRTPEAGAAKGSRAPTPPAPDWAACSKTRVW